MTMLSIPTSINQRPRRFRVVLQFLAILPFLTGLLHLFLGLGADVLLGANIPPEVQADAALDSQNRFYGVSFMLYGALLYLCATDLKRYAPVLICLLLTFWAAGIARLVTLLLYGFPPPLVGGLLIAELLIPPLLLAWFRHVRETL